MNPVNAKIESTMLGLEDHGIFTFYLYLDYGGSKQGAGGFALDSWKKDLGRRIGTAEGMEFIARILRVVGAEKWEDLPGMCIRAKSDWTRVHAIGHYLKEDWLDFDTFFKDPLSMRKD